MGVSVREGLGRVSRSGASLLTTAAGAVVETEAEAEALRVFLTLGEMCIVDAKKVRGEKDATAGVTATGSTAAAELC